MSCAATGTSRPGNRPEELKSNQKNSGFLPRSAPGSAACFDELGFVDVLQAPESEADQYTWWSNRGRAWAKNVGGASITRLPLPSPATRARNDHKRSGSTTPLGLDYDYPL